MNIAVLCPGPSLATWPDETLTGYHRVIGVNRAAYRVPCTDWVFGDMTHPMQGQPENPIRCWTKTATMNYLRRHGVECNVVNTFEAMEVRWPHEWNWHHFSLPAALVVAAELGAKQITVYGNDRTDEPDFDGVMTDGNNRGENRWQREAEIVERVAAELTALGHSITWA